MKEITTTIEDFKELVQKYYFVDKSYFIANFLDSLCSKVLIFTRPNKFGKTILLSMLDYFFNIEDSIENRKLFKNLIIERLDPEYMTKQGSKPVIFISLKDIAANNFDEFLQKFSNVMADLYSKHEYLLTNPQLTPRDKTVFNEIRTKSADYAVLSNSFKYLTYFLAKYYDKQVILLIDDYDVPFLSASENNYYDDSICFLARLYSGSLKTNEFLDFAILTGVANVLKGEPLSQIDNFPHYSLLSDRFSDSFGFTQDDLNQLVRYYNLDTKIEEIENLYGGYLFGTTKIYNPWSVNNYIKNNTKPQTYFVNTSSNAIFDVLLKDINGRKRVTLERLINGGYIEKDVNEMSAYDNIATNDSSLFTTLLFCGYLTIEEKESEFMAYICKLKIPNKEILDIYKYNIISKIFEDINAGPKEMYHAMLSGQHDKFQKILQSILIKNASFYDTHESFYHGLLLGLTTLLNDKYTIKSNYERDYTRFDLALFPKIEKYPAIILELKVSKEGDNLQNDAKDALEQIKSKNYLVEFKENNITRLWKYGIAFSKEEIFIQNETIYCNSEEFTTINSPYHHVFAGLSA